MFFVQHKPMSEITSGLHRGIYHQGKLRVNRYNSFEAYVGSESIGDEIIIYGRGNMNRAFDGDIVAVELLPQDQWHEEKSLSLAEEGMLESHYLFGLLHSICMSKADQQLYSYAYFLISTQRLINKIGECLEMLIMGNKNVYMSF